MKALSCLSLMAMVLMAPVPVAAQDAAPAEGAKLDPRDPNAIRCRRLDVTGSLVKKERVCRTNAEWARIADQQRNDGGNLIERSRAGMNPNGS